MMVFLASGLASVPVMLAGSLAAISSNTSTTLRSLGASTVYSFFDSPSLPLPPYMVPCIEGWPMMLPGLAAKYSLMLTVSPSISIGSDCDQRWPSASTAPPFFWKIITSVTTTVPALSLKALLGRRMAATMLALLEMDSRSLRFIVPSRVNRLLMATTRPPGRTASMERPRK